MVDVMTALQKDKFNRCWDTGDTFYHSNPTQLNYSAIEAEVSFYVRYLVCVTDSLDQLDALAILTFVLQLFGIESSKEIEAFTFFHWDKVCEEITKYCCSVCAAGEEESFFLRKIYMDVPILKDALLEAAERREAAKLFIEVADFFKQHPSKELATYSPKRQSIFKERELNSPLEENFLNLDKKKQDFSYGRNGVYKRGTLILNLDLVNKSISSGLNYFPVGLFSSYSDKVPAKKENICEVDASFQSTANKQVSKAARKDLQEAPNNYTSVSHEKYSSALADLDAPVGVRFCIRTNRWVAQGVVDHQKHTRHFGVKRWGFKGAKKQAIRFRKKVEKMRRSKAEPTEVTTRQLESASQDRTERSSESHDLSDSITFDTNTEQDNKITFSFPSRSISLFPAANSSPFMDNEPPSPDYALLALIRKPSIKGKK